MPDYKKIVFLDIDGVLSSIPFLCKGKGHIDPENVQVLNKLKDIGAEMVISSSWGQDEGNTEKALLDCGLELPIVGYTEHFHVDWLCRGNEIEKWLQVNFGGMDYEFVIFDDDTNFLLGQKDNFIHINDNTGITDEDIEKAIKILMRENG